ncbi:winged helix-turn-helix transcriptional regulator [Shimia litoralis]|uniref:Winged helix-turn-helix transcriptional regulator n=1 Tax=Shimia litoralis TaxID=420403 RepID=A0A4V6F117_9RHOB|nr:MarR family winged helix-turn-helix transcriptional regulator [Shimia litoralis]TKZ17501.1 winged helix-turn-helix transcriptional regulator [Shimia litoralis]
MTTHTQIRELINRLARLDAASGWAGNLNPTQRSVLGYLARANQFSRSPSHVSDYLGTTRGTTTQSLKSLLQKGYVKEQRSELDKRVISYALTPKGQDIAGSAVPMEDALNALGSNERDALQSALLSTLRNALAKNGGREFGLCKTCIHHREKGGAPYCALLKTALSAEEADQICHEQVPV